MLIGIIVIIVILLLYIFLSYNALTKSRLRVRQAESGIDVYLTQRFELIPNLIECVKAYCQYEANVLDEIAELRSSYRNNKDLKIGEKLDEKYYGIMAIAENNPELKASEQFLNLQKSLAKIESQIQAARRIYNSEVTNLNIMISTLPINLIARLFKFEEESLFEADIEAKETLRINLNKKGEK